ncbi:hypothetical protein [Methylobacterium frigidaeris]|uniref:Uncharacterized protein n=1 Tax=Methylobacterium frigidaeris TaxID=2038277 RepID=A0AA37HIY7_9HYPH|nr:hypothetical protein [Methylobacterium frigidaeris]PIK73716.1 hypothetical protein CS379_06855 [Methylobacterium frigidaeris]GJD66972.1 hypothetical protein MPEAHAMD_7171 [Methylobacterium frigidaeris]
MSITYPEAWIPGPDGRSRVRQVYRDDESIGRVRRWREEEPGELTGEWFTAERKKGAFYVPIAGEHATFEEALERIVFYSAVQ